MKNNKIDFEGESGHRRDPLNPGSATIYHYPQSRLVRAEAVEDDTDDSTKATLTVTFQPETLSRLEIAAREQDTTIDELVPIYITEWIDENLPEDTEGGRDR